MGRSCDDDHQPKKTYIHICNPFCVCLDARYFSYLSKWQTQKRIEKQNLLPLYWVVIIQCIYEHQNMARNFSLKYARNFEYLIRS